MIGDAQLLREQQHEPTPAGVIGRRSDAELAAYVEGFETGARLIRRHWRRGIDVDRSEELAGVLLATLIEVLSVADQPVP